MYRIRTSKEIAVTFNGQFEIQPVESQDERKLVDVIGNDLPCFLNENNLSIEHDEILGPPRIKIGIGHQTIGFLIEPVYKDEKIDGIMKEMLTRPRKYNAGIHLSHLIEGRER